MKLLFKIVILILTARVLAGTPRGGNKDLDAIGDLNLRGVASGITSAVAKAEGAVRALWWEKTPAPPKAVARQNSGEHRPADSF